MQWDTGVLKNKPTVDVHIMSSVFHYGQCLFEGIKGFEGKDKHVRFDFLVLGLWQFSYKAGEGVEVCITVTLR
jgi:hypothetical protein